MKQKLACVVVTLALSCCAGVASAQTRVSDKDVERMMQNLDNDAKGLPRPSTPRCSIPAFEKRPAQRTQKDW